MTQRFLCGYHLPTAPQEEEYGSCLREAPSVALKVMDLTYRFKCAFTSCSDDHGQVPAPGLRHLLLTVRVSVGLLPAVQGLVRKWEMHAGPSQGVWYKSGPLA